MACKYNLKPGSVVGQEDEQRALEVTASQQVVEMMSKVVVSPLQAVVAIVRVLGMKEKRELELGRISFKQLSHGGHHERVTCLGAAAIRQLTAIAAFSDHVERAHVMVDRLSTETEHSIRERSHVW